MEDSKYQIAIFDEVKKGKTDILVKATAGSGKTTTIVKASKLLPKYLDIIFLAFNVSIVEELKNRLPNNVKCQTLHSLGMRSLYGYYKSKIKVTKYKTIGFAEKVLKTKKLSPQDYKKAKFTVNEMLNVVRLNLIENEQTLINEVCDYYGILFDNNELEIAREVYDNLMEYNAVKYVDEKSIDFVDMIYIPSLYDEIIMPKYDVVFIDESQDLNKCQQILVKKIKKPKGRAIYVGDANQAIYMFAGADANSFNNIIEPETKQLPLSVCYRCAKNVVIEAQKTIGPLEIEYFDGSPDGYVTEGDINDIQEGDMVVCRNNAPLFSLYFDLLVEGKKAVIRGKEIQEALMKAVNKIQYSDTIKGIEKLDLEIEKLHDKIEKEGKNPDFSGRYQKLREIRNIISLLSEDCDMMLEVKDKLEDIFSEKKQAIDLMTIHKAKGLERNTVHFLNPELIPSRFANTKEELIQERNLMFVAQTRAIEHLNYIRGYVNRNEREEE